MINEVLLVEDLLQGKGLNKICLYQHCYLIAKYYLQSGISALETRQNIFSWACEYHLYLEATKLNVNRLIYKAQEDRRRLNENDVYVSEQDIKEITERFDTPKVRKTALALLCYAKAFADRDNVFEVSIASLTNWTGLGLTQMRVAYLKELQTFGYIQKIESEKTRTFSWDDNVKSRSAQFKLCVPFSKTGKHKLVDNNIDNLYKECFQ